MRFSVRKFSATGWVTFQHLFEQLFWLTLFAIQAPLLGPKPFGLVSIVMVFVGFCEYVVTSAAAEVLISLRVIDALHYKTMTAAATAGAVVFGCGLYASADWFAVRFADPQLSAIVRVMAYMPLISALAAAPTAAIKRNMDFRSTAIRAMASLLIAGGVSLVLTLRGAGVWALIVQAVLQRAVATIVMWRTAPIRFGIAWSARHFRDMRQFASKLALSCLMNWSAGQLPRFILGLYLGLADLGLYALAARLVDILTQIAVEPKTTVARINLRQFADDAPGLHQQVKKMLLQMSVLCFPMFIGAAALTPTLFHAWLDARWFAAIVPAQIMLLGGVPIVTFYCTTAILLALNRQSAEMLLSTVQTFFAAVAVWVAAPFGLVAASAAVAFRPLLILALPLALLAGQAGIAPRFFLANQSVALSIATLMGISVWLLGKSLEANLPPALLLPILIAAGAALYAGGIATAMPAFAREIFETVTLRFRISAPGPGTAK